VLPPLDSFNTHSGSGRGSVQWVLSEVLDFARIPVPDVCRTSDKTLFITVTTESLVSAARIRFNAEDLQAFKYLMDHHSDLFVKNA
jgi:hypothetical protein